MDSIEDLLKKLESLKKAKRKSESEYNVFQVLEIENKEVIMCRFLADLLNPEGSHHQGIKYLKSFVEEVLHISLSDKQYAGFCVYKEYPIQKDRRIDIVLQNKEYFWPIEVKIHAGEQRSQCYDYYQFASRINRNAKVIYLTKWGSLPSEYSLKSANGEECLPENRVLCISFARDICDWLEKVLQQENETMKLLIQQYLEAIHSFTWNTGRRMKMSVSDTILEKEEYFRTALEIEASMKAVKAELIHRVLEEFERQMEPLAKQLGLEREQHFSWYEYKEQATEDFYHCYSTYPGINYVVKDIVLPNNIEVWFRIEVEHNLYAGICLFDADAKAEYENGCQIDSIGEQLEAEVLKYLNLQNVKRDDWWLTWWYLPTGMDKYKIGAKSVPNFKELNDAAIRLVEENNLKEFVKKSIDVIEAMLRQILNRRSI